MRNGPAFEKLHLRALCSRCSSSRVRRASTKGTFLESSEAALSFLAGERAKEERSDGFGEPLTEEEGGAMGN